MPSSYQHATRRPTNGTYVPASNAPADRDVTAAVIGRALIAFYKSEHLWPLHEHEFQRWARIRRAHGISAPCLPGPMPIARVFPDFDDAIAYAQERETPRQSP